MYGTYRFDNENHSWKKVAVHQNCQSFYFNNNQQIIAVQMYHKQPLTTIKNNHKLNLSSIIYN